MINKGKTARFLIIAFLLITVCGCGEKSAVTTASTAKYTTLESSENTKESSSAKNDSYKATKMSAEERSKNESFMKSTGIEDTFPEASEKEEPELKGDSPKEDNTAGADINGINESADGDNPALQAENVPKEIPAENPAEGISGNPDTAPPVSPSSHVVTIDPGHQISADYNQEPLGPGSQIMKERCTTGTQGVATGIPEYELDLAVSLKLRDILVQRGYTVHMTRESHNVNLGNIERANVATLTGSEILVRVHANSVADSSVSGAVGMTPSYSNAFIGYMADKCERLTSCVLNGVIGATGCKNTGILYTDEMAGMNWSTVPVTIIEMGFMSNPNEDMLMADDGYRNAIATGIANGIDEYFR